MPMLTTAKLIYSPMVMLIYLPIMQLVQDYARAPKQLIFVMIFSSIMETILVLKKLPLQLYQLLFMDTSLKVSIHLFIQP
jgi:hypothetical protein